MEPSQDPPPISAARVCATGSTMFFRARSMRASTEFTNGRSCDVLELALLVVLQRRKATCRVSYASHASCMLTPVSVLSVILITWSRCA
jgi:hypothetical protein